MKCPKCLRACDRDEVDVGVGVIHGPWGCRCGWSEDPRYDSSEGISRLKASFQAGLWIPGVGWSGAPASNIDENRVKTRKYPSSEKIT